MALKILSGGVLTLGKGTGLQIAGGFDPASIAGLYADFDAAQGLLDASDAAITADATAIKTVQDQSGGGIHLTQGTAGNRPLFKTAQTPNGKPVIRFDGSDDYLSNAAVTVGNACTIVAAVRLNATPASHCGLLSLIAGANRQSCIPRRNAASNFMSYWNTTDGWKESNLSLTGSTWYVLTFKIAEASNLSIYANGTSRLSTALAAAFADWTTLLVGSGQTTADRFPGDMARMLVYTAALSDSDRQKAERGLGQQYGISF